MTFGPFAATSPTPEASGSTMRISIPGSALPTLPMGTGPSGEVTVSTGAASVSP